MKKVLRISIVLTLSLLVFSQIGKSDNSEIDDFTGTGHIEGCHGSGNAVFSILGATVELNSSAGLEVNAGEIFEISVTIKGFLEAVSDSVSLGFLPDRTDNAMFTFDVFKSYNNIAINSSGNADTVNFTVTAPQVGGDYVLTADAIMVAGNFTYTYGILQISVIAAGNPPGNELIMVLLFIGITIAGIAGMLVILVKKQKAKRFF
jgi:hypothetical protein